MPRFRPLRRPFVVAAAALLVLLSLGVALAAPAAQEGKRGLFGVVTAVTADTITVRQDSEALTIKVDSKTQYKVPGVSAPTLTDIPVGSRVALVTEQRPDGTYATLVGLVQAQPKEQHLTITVLEVSGRTVIGETGAGEQVVVELAFDLPGELKGQVVTFVGELLESGRFTARAALNLKSIIARLDKQVREAKGRAEAERDPGARAQKQRDVEDLKAKLESNLQEHLDRFNEVIAKAPPQAKPALEQALENIKKGYQSATAALDKTEREAQDLLNRRSIVGTVEQVDLAANQVVVHTRGDALVTVKVTGTTQIRIAETVVTLRDLRAGDPVEVRMQPATGEADRIQVRLVAEVDGIVKAVTTPSTTGTPVLILQLSGNATISLAVPSTARIRANNLDAPLSSITPGLEVEARYNTRTLELISLDAELEAELELVVESVDVQARTITGRTREGKTVTLRVTERTRVEAKGSLSSIFGVQRGMLLEAKINPLTGEALRLKLEKPEEKKLKVARAQGVVTLVDPGKGTFTMRLPNKSEITLTVTSTTKVEVEGEKSTLAGLQRGMLARVEYDPDSLAASQVEGERLDRRPPERPRTERLTVAGTITALDPAKGTITIFTKRGETLVLTIKADTAMALNEKRVAALADLPSAAVVEVEYTADGIALKISARKGGEETRRGTDREREAAPLKAEGTVVSVDASKGTVTVRTERGVTLVLTVKGDTVLTLNQRPLRSLSDIPVGAAVEVEYTADGIALKISARRQP